MGICGSKDAEQQLSSNIDRQLKEIKKDSDAEIKLLLLGAGESGKTTILKQMKMIHLNGYDIREKNAFKPFIFSNIIVSIKALLAAREKLQYPFENSGTEAAVEKVNAVDEVQMNEFMDLPYDLAVSIKSIWKDPAIQNTFKRSNQFQIYDSAEYFFDELDRVSDPNYIPNNQDILRCRTKTTGIIETKFKMYDVGGQRSERKKWIHCFESVQAIVFLVAISEYDQVLVEDESINRMEEALTLFDSICNSKWFVNTSIILFLNKIDIFKTKILNVPIENTFPDYEGGPDFDSAKNYFKTRFLELNNNEDKQIFTHFTCCTDTSNVKFVMDSVHQIIIKERLKNANLI